MSLKSTYCHFVSDTDTCTSKVTLNESLTKWFWYKKEVWMQLWSYAKFSCEKVCKILLLVQSHTKLVKSQASFPSLLTVFCHWRMCELRNLFLRDENRKRCCIIAVVLSLFWERGGQELLHTTIFNCYFYWKVIQ